MDVQEIREKDFSAHRRNLLLLFVRIGEILCLKIHRNRTKGGERCEFLPFFCLLWGFSRGKGVFLHAKYLVDMKYAVIAAGEGSRLAQEGVTQPKPLVCLSGEPMIDRHLRIFRENGAERVSLIVNTLHPETEAHVRELMASGKAGVEVDLVVKSTPSSMHSFFELAPSLEGSDFCLTTVDTIFREKEFSDYIRAFQSCKEDGMMAVTDYIDDEKPLYVGVDEEMNITGFFDSKQEDSRYVSGGIYCLRGSALRTLYRCMAEGQSRMRNFQRGLIEDGLRLKAYCMSKVLDVDHAEDIRKAEEFLIQAQR